MTVPPPPTVPTGTVTHRYLGVSADGPDTDTAPDLIHLRAVTGTITPSTPRLIHTSGSTATTLECLPITISYDASGHLQYTDPETGEPQPGPLRLPANDDSIAPTITYEVVWSIPGLGRRWSGSFALDAGDTVDLSTVGLASAVPGSSAVFVDLLRAAAELEGVVDVVSDARDEAVAARDVAVPAADRAEQARDATLTAATWALTGPGRPDQPATTGGIITGSEPVGTAYISTDGAGVGAWTWRKRPSGWTVTDGDTGWRDLSGLLVNGWTGTLIVRRVGSRVELQAPHSTIGRLDGSAATSSVVTPYPAGFRPAPSGNFGNLGYMHGPDGPLTVQRETSHIGMQLGPSRTGSVDWITDAAWPTDLAPAAALPDESITLAGGAYWDNGEIVIPQQGASGDLWIQTSGRVSDLAFSPEVLVPGPTPVIFAATRYFAADRSTAAENSAGRIADTSGRNIAVPNEWTRPTPIHTFQIGADVHWVRLTFGGSSPNWVVPGTRYRISPDDITPTYL